MATQVIRKMGRACGIARSQRVAARPRENFLMLVPEKLQTDPSISTE